MIMHNGVKIKREINLFRDFFWENRTKAFSPDGFVLGLIFFFSLMAGFPYVMASALSKYQESLNGLYRRLDLAWNLTAIVRLATTSPSNEFKF